ncbi:MAG: hypothetical protein ACFCU2_07245 [Acidimicrobiia bacterium]
MDLLAFADLLLPDATMIPLPMFLPMTVALTILFTWVYNNTGGSLIATVLMHFLFNFSGAFLAGHLGLMPPMLLYVGGGITIGIFTIVVVALNGKVNLSRKSMDVMPFSRVTGRLPSSPRATGVSSRS